MKHAFILAALAPLLACAAAQAFGVPDLAATAPLWAALQAVMLPAVVLPGADAQGQLVTEEGADPAAAGSQPTGTEPDDADADADAGKDKPKRTPKLIKARVLFTGAFGKINSVATVDAATLKAGVANGELDPHKDAVAYAEQLAG